MKEFLYLLAGLSVFSFPRFGLAETEITLSLNKSGNPVVEYKRPSEGNIIPFVDIDSQTNALVRSPLWEAEPGCALAYDQFAIHLTDCPRPRFTLTWDGVIRDRRYPPMVRLENGGVLVFTQYLQTHLGNKFASWRVIAPKGGVAVFRGQQSNEEITIPGNTFEGDLRGWVYLGPDKFAREPLAKLLVDDGISTSVSTALAKTVPDLLRFYSKAIGADLKDIPSIYLVWGNRNQPGHSFQADVVRGNVIRFGLSGAGWKEAQPENLAALRAVIAHELAHLWNSGIFAMENSQVSWIHEGNAELLSVAALLATNQIDNNAAAERINTALAECILLSKGKAWVDIEQRNRGKAPYACGMAIQFALLGAANERDRSVDAHLFWRSLWKDSPRYGEAAILQFVEKTAGRETANTMRLMLNEKTTALGPALIKLLETARLTMTLNGELPKNLRSAVVQDVVASLLKSDCSGNTGFRTMDAYLQLDETIRCKGFIPGARIRYLQDMDVLSNTRETLSAGHRSCVERNALRFKSNDDNEFIVTCSAEMAAILASATHFPWLATDEVSRVLVAR